MSSNLGFSYYSGGSSSINPNRYYENEDADLDLFSFDGGRTLEENVTLDDDAAASCEDLAGSNDAQVLRNTMRFYGGIFLAILVVFCLVRRRFPRVYNLRNRVDELRTELAADSYGTIAWMWKLFGITDTEMMEECGMDALCYTRVLELGMKLSLVGILNAVWLIPVYATASGSAGTDCIEDWVIIISVSHLPSGSLRFCATVVAAYVIFGFAMFSILQEFIWFSRYRHQFLSKPLPRNYCVYVQCIPTEYQTNAALLEFFQQVSSQNSVLEAHLAVKAPQLQKLVAQRESLVAKLEHSISLEDVRGITPMVGVLGGSGQSLIAQQFRQLQTLNQSITESIDRIERKSKGLVPRDVPEEQESTANENASMTLDQQVSLLASGKYGAIVEEEEQSRVSALTFDKNPRLGNGYGGIGSTEQTIATIETDDRIPAYLPASLTNNTATLLTTNNTNGSASNTLKTSSATKSFKGSLKSAKGSLKSAANVVGTVGSAAASLLTAEEDGQPMSAGFVTFKSLRAAQAAQQMIQFSEPFAMEVLEAPQPEDIMWKNVGKTHKELQMGKLISFALTVTLCLLWTIPMGFISTLSSIEGLRGEFKFIDDLLNKYEWLEPFFAQLAPLLIVVANELLKVILELLSGLEGPISGAVVQAKLFTKLSSFMIIQTFFVTAIGGSIMSELSAMIQEPGLIIDLLAKTLPTQSTFYIQILLVDTFLSMGIELLRVSSLGMALVRRLVGPRLTEKERTATWMGLRPLCDPVEFEHANLLAGTVLYFTVYFVYAALAPITCFFMFMCFTLMASGYRHQFVYIYPTFPDSGGKLWSGFLRMVPVCMIIAETTIVGMLALNKAAAASAMMIPLLVITILFTVYIHQKHFALTENLPAKDAVMSDLRNNAERAMDVTFLKEKYVQPELREREVFPENSTVEREMEHGCVQFVTPPGSETGDDEFAENP